jgi:large subunit ribosomal protein L4
METKVYNTKGIEAGKVKLPQEIFGLPWNADLVHQVAVSMMSNARQPIAHSKMRGEVRGGGKKPWRQKGTGRARHGSTRSPIWVGGGTTHGPRNDKDYSRKVNKKMKTKALFTILSAKVADGSLIFVDSLSFKEPKTSDAKDMITNLSKIAGLEKLAKKRTNALCIALSKKDITVEKSFRNIGSVKVEELRNVNPLDILNTAFLLIENPEESIKLLTGKSAK